MKKTNRTGLTIVELMVAVSAACIVVLSAGIILVYGQKSWDQGLRQAHLQREVSLVMLRVKKSISEGRAAVVDNDGLGVKIYNSAGWIRYRYEAGQNDLVYQIDGEEERTLLDGIVQDASFDLDPNTGKMVLVDIDLEKDGAQAGLSSKTLMRNF
ncbi:MAG: hypothetical protein JW749_06425 [Sedimentisphaerales bacterium]|nr:hypothetical protein [Sedimentisphaerales bacterium]